MLLIRSPWPNVFPAGVANFGEAMYRSLERSTQDTRDGFFFVQCPGLIFLAARWSGPATSASIFSAFLDYILRVCQSLRDSFFYLGKLHWFHICCYPITTILACLFSVGVRISWKKLCWMRAWRRRWHLVSPTLYIIIVYRVNLNKLSRNFVAAIRKTTTNCRVSFIDLYLVFPTNFRTAFLPHTNTVNLLEPYCGTITEPGLPVSLLGKANLHEMYSQTTGTWKCWTLPPWFRVSYVRQFELSHSNLVNMAGLFKAGLR